MCARVFVYAGVQFGVCAHTHSVSSHTNAKKSYHDSESRPNQNVPAKERAHFISTQYKRTAMHCNTLQHTAPHCTTLHHTATHCKKNITNFSSQNNTIHLLSIRQPEGSVAQQTLGNPPREAWQ